MERHAHYTLVGLLSTAILLAAMIFAVWLGSAGFGRSHEHYRIVFQGPARGLSEGSDVQFNGIKAGRIESIGLDSREPSLVVADVRLNAGTPVRADSVATIEPEGISGMNVIQISAGSPGQPLLRQIQRSDRPVIRSSTDAYASLSALLPGGGQLVRNASDMLGRMNHLLSDRTVTDMTMAIHDIRLTTDAIAENRAMFAHASSTLAKLDDTATDMQRTAASLRAITGGDGRHAVSDIAAAAAELKLAIGDARGILARVNTQSESVSTTTLPDLDATLLSIQQTADSLDRLLRGLRQNPREALGKDGGKELELRP